MRGRQLPEAVLLDTCAVIWLANADPMAKAAIDAIYHAARNGGVFISPISAWEIGLATRPNARRPSSLQLQLDPKTWFAKVMSGVGVRPAPFAPDIAIGSSYLPGDLHGDPADRIIIATARHLGVPVVTRDHRIIDYGRAGHVAVIAC